MSTAYICPPTEWACTPKQAWHFRNAERLPRIPQAADFPCDASHSVGWFCNRRDDHTGRHAATLSGGYVVAVWS